MCVPGGAAAYPSTVLMTVVPAQAAGVDRSRRGAADGVRLVQPRPARDLPRTGRDRGVSHRRGTGGGGAGVWRRRPYERVDKIVGPGNLFVALAKKFVFGEVRHRLDRRAQRGDRHRRRQRRGRIRGGRPDRPGRACAGVGDLHHLERRRCSTRCTRNWKSNLRRWSAASWRGSRSKRSAP